MHLNRNSALVPTNACRYRQHRPELDSHSIGFLTAAPLPDMVDVRLFTASGTVVAAVTYLQEMAPLTREQEELVEGFHRFLVTTVLAPGAGLAWEGAPAPLLLPLLGDTLDLDLCARVAKHGGAPERPITFNPEFLAKYKGESFYYDQVFSLPQLIL